MTYRNVTSSGTGLATDLGLNTEALDLREFWHAPLARYRVAGPLWQEIRSPSADTDPTDSSPFTEPVVPRRRAHQGAHAERFLVIGRWRGWVTNILVDTFIGEVEDLKSMSPPHEVELPQALLSDFDRPLLNEDAIFYWTVGYRHRPGGTRVQEARVRFRRRPLQEPWVARSGTAWAARVRAALGNDAD